MLNVSAVVLAAGSSRRMGYLKPLLPLNHQTILDYLLGKLLACDFTDIVIVTGYQAASLQKGCHHQNARLRWVYNPNYTYGQSTSLKKGMTSASEKHLMIFLADMPFLLTDTLTHILQTGCEQARKNRSAFYVRPSYHQQPGHPVFIGHYHAIDQTVIQGDIGAKPLLQRMTTSCIVPVKDWGVIYDIDTPERYHEAQNWVRQHKDI